MRRTRLRLRVLDEGAVEVIDPGWESLPLLRELDADYRVETAPLDGFVAPRLACTAGAGVGCQLDALDGLDVEALWVLHDTGIAEGRARRWSTHGVRTTGEASLLDLKRAIARRLLRACVLCARRCGVDRTAGERGPCLLGAEALMAEAFVHIAEEAPINPSMVFNLAGCGLRCRYCQQWEILDPRRAVAVPLRDVAWEALDLRGARSISYVGGNPTESLPAVLDHLAAMPLTLGLPVVVNTHGYDSLEVVRLLEGVADVWLPDWKYGAAACGRRWSGVDDYPATAARAIGAMAAQGVPVIVRVLVLPGHGACCHERVIAGIADITGDVRVSVRAQYSPDGRITEGVGPMGRRPTRDEVGAVQARVAAAGGRGGAIGLPVTRHRGIAPASE